MKNKLFKGVEVFLALTIIIGLFVTGRQASNYKRGEQDYNEAEELANLSEETKVSPPSAKTILTKSTAEDSYATMLKEKIDFSTLQEVNSDVLGWIEIPGTELSYPIMQGEDNDYYLNHTWKGESNSVGSIFFECQVDPEFADFNTIIYGHRMRDLSMFGSLKYYNKLSYWEEHPSVYVVTEEEVYRYDIYAAYKASPEDIIYGLKISSRPKKQELIQFGLENSMIDTKIIPTTYDRILTLSTCTGTGHASRWVVQGVYRVESSGIPETMGGFEEIDDVSYENAANSKDALTFTDEDNISREPSSWSMAGIYIQITALIGLVAMAIIEIILTLKKRRNESSGEQNEKESSRGN